MVQVFADAACGVAMRAVLLEGPVLSAARPDLWKVVFFQQLAIFICADLVSRRTAESMNANCLAHVAHTGPNHDSSTMADNLHPGGTDVSEPIGERTQGRSAY